MDKKKKFTRRLHDTKRLDIKADFFRSIFYIFNMNPNITYLVLVIVFVFGTDSAKLPSYFKQCKTSDPELGKCITGNINNNLQKFADGSNSYRIRSLKPLKVPFVHIDVNGGLIFNLTNVEASGLENSVFSESSIDFDKKTFHFKMFIPLATILADYDVTGRILILPITGQGPANITFVNANVDYSFEYDLQEKGKHNYIVPKNSKMTYEPERAYFKLDNLFNGDKRLGEEMSKFLDENWKPVNEEIGAKVGEAIGQIITNLIGEFFTKVSLEEMFEKS